MNAEFVARAAAARAAQFDTRIFTFGAQDALRIAAFAGFNAIEIAKAAILNHRNHHTTRINAKTIWNLMSKCGGDE